MCSIFRSESKSLCRVRDLHFPGITIPDLYKFLARRRRVRVRSSIDFANRIEADVPWNERDSISNVTCARYVILLH